VRRARRSSNNYRRIEIWRIVVWSGLTNLLLLSVFFAAQRFDVVSFLAVGPKIEKADDRSIAKPNDPVFVRAEMGLMVPISGKPGGEPQHVAVVPPLTPKGDFSMSTMVVAKTEPESEAETVDEEATSTADLALAAGASVDDSEALRLKPILLQDPKTHKLEIGNFKSLSVVGSPQDCLDFGYSLLSGANTSNDKLDVMTAGDEITIARICAANGSVIITCRGGQIAVSPRRPRPDDHCSANG
jgi:hypothetical protein